MNDSEGWIMWRRRKRERQERDDDVFAIALGDECEAFLAGRFGQHLVEWGQPVPPVGWLNQVVHGTVAELAQLAVTAPSRPAQPLRWSRAVGYLARSLLERGRETGRPVEELQRELLVPLELELIGRPDAIDLDPADLVRITLARLYELPERSA